MPFCRHSHSCLLNYFQVVLFLTVSNRYGPHNWKPILPKLDMDLVSSPITSHQKRKGRNALCSPTTLLSWDNHPPAATNSNWMKTTCNHIIWMLTPFSHLAGVAGGVENHTILCPSPQLHINAPAFIYTLFFYLPL